MAHEFKAGDLALIVMSRFPDSPNVGCAVELIQLVRPGETIKLPNGNEDRFAGPNESWLVAGNVLCRKTSGWVDEDGVAYVKPSHMVPLRGDFQPEQHKAKESEPCA